MRVAPVRPALRPVRGPPGLQSDGSAPARSASGGQRERSLGQVDLPPGDPRRPRAGLAPQRVQDRARSGPEAAGSDYVLVNLYRRFLGRAMSAGSVEELVVRLSAQVGFRARPHMLRHSFASEVALATKDPALVKELLGHASVASTDVYMHARWADMRAAIDGHAGAAGARP
ncbi:MAG: tyrosine-type recombinase/integrase [Acidimicrobiales bacterium]